MDEFTFQHMVAWIARQMPDNLHIVATARMLAFVDEYPGIEDCGWPSVADRSGAWELSPDDLS
jgi:hypothetical protein